MFDYILGWDYKIRQKTLVHRQYKATDGASNASPLNMAFIWVYVEFMLGHNIFSYLYTNYYILTIYILTIYILTVLPVKKLNYLDILSHRDGQSSC